MKHGNALLNAGEFVRKLLPTIFAALLILASVSSNLLAQGAKAQLTPVNTAAILGKANGVYIEGKVQSPSAQPTPLQIVCVFEYQEGDLTGPRALPAAANGLLHVDVALHGLITELRKNGKFKGRRLETLLLNPPKGTISAQKLLLIGLGNRNEFTPSLMADVGRVGMREALRLNVSSYSHASNLKDAGIDSPTDTVVVNVVKGALDALETAQYLESRKLTNPISLTKFTLLAGQAFYASSSAAIKAYLFNRN